MFASELAEEGYSGVEVRNTPARLEIIIRATRTQEVLGQNGRRIRELTSVVKKRFGFADGGVELYAEKVLDRGLSAQAQAESLKYKLLGGLAVRRACYGVLRYVLCVVRSVSACVNDDEKSIVQLKYTVENKALSFAPI